jgi:o-succinylbenzoate synthase
MNVEQFSLSLVEPLSTASGTIERREGVVVHGTAVGAEGVGEATPLPPWTEDLVDCRAALAAAPDDLDAAHRTVDPEETPAAAHGIELARVDAHTRAAGVPLSTRLGDGRSVGRVPVNAILGDGAADATAGGAHAAVRAGFPAVKVKVGARTVEADADRLAAARKAVGPDVELRADANGAYDGEAEARAALEAFADSDPAYVEQPVPAEAVETIRSLADAPVPVAIDETAARLPMPSLLSDPPAAVVVLKPMAMGGPLRTAVAAASLREHGVRPVVTTTVDAVHARTAAVHVAATLPDPPACGLATAGMLAEDLAEDPAPVEDGHVEVPSAPGNLPADHGHHGGVT